MILADAEIKGDRETALSWNIHPRTIQNYRERLSWDVELVSNFQRLRKIKQQNWIEEVPSAISLGVEFLKNSFRSAGCTDSDTIAAVTAAIEMLADLELTREMINKRLGNENPDQS